MKEYVEPVKACINCENNRGPVFPHGTVGLMGILLGLEEPMSCDVVGHIHKPRKYVCDSHSLMYAYTYDYYLAKKEKAKRRQRANFRRVDKR
jgi:hypothetical protein